MSRRPRPELEAGPRAAKRARRVGLAVLVLLALGMCTLRFHGLRSERDDAYDAAVAALAEAAATPGGTARFDDARDAADHLARTGATLLDARATFVLKVVDDVQRLAGEPDPGPTASRYERVAWFIAENRLDDAAELLAEARDNPDLDAERVALYVQLVDDLKSAQDE